jgi:hypothetical protein
MNCEGVLNKKISRILLKRLMDLTGVAFLQHNGCK